MQFENLTLAQASTCRQALACLDRNHQGFVMVLREDGTVAGVLTDGDLRRAFLAGKALDDSIDGAYTTDFSYVVAEGDLSEAAEAFKPGKIKFVPVLSAGGHLVNVITRDGLHALLMRDLPLRLDHDFLGADTSVVDGEIFLRPWGYFKTTVLNDCFHVKILKVMPGCQLSLQSHQYREEFWTVANGEGKAVLAGSEVVIMPGSTVFIPQNCPHRLINTSTTEILTVSEVQKGSYFGEDDIQRIEDVYGRAEENG